MLFGGVILNCRTIQAFPEVHGLAAGCRSRVSRARPVLMTFSVPHLTCFCRFAITLLWKL